MLWWYRRSCVARTCLQTMTIVSLGIVLLLWIVAGQTIYHSNGVSVTTFLLKVNEISYLNYILNTHSFLSTNRSGVRQRSQIVRTEFRRHRTATTARIVIRLVLQRTFALQHHIVNNIVITVISTYRKINITIMNIYILNNNRIIIILNNAHTRSVSSQLPRRSLPSWSVCMSPPRVSTSRFCSSSTTKHNEPMKIIVCGESNQFKSNNKAKS